MSDCKHERVHWRIDPQQTWIVEVCNDCGMSRSHWEQGESSCRIHTTTWGEAARHKEWAAELGVRLARSAGGLVELAEKNAELCEGQRLALLNIEATARKWAVSAGGNTPLALIAKMARDVLGMSTEEVDAVISALKEPKP